MGPIWSKWSVYEYMKQCFMRTGRIPDESELQQAFAGIDQAELREGIAEFGTIADGWPGLEVRHATEAD